MRVFLIKHDQLIIIEENCGRFIKSNTVLFDILAVLFVMPLDKNTHNMYILNY
ncbi:hypothetical protein D3C86_2056260 [compost metagenome]